MGKHSSGAVTQHELTQAAAREAEQHLASVLVNAGLPTADAVEIELGLARPVSGSPADEHAEVFVAEDAAAMVASGEICVADLRLEVADDGLRSLITDAADTARSLAVELRDALLERQSGRHVRQPSL